MHDESLGCAFAVLSSDEPLLLGEDPKALSRIQAVIVQEDYIPGRPIHDSKRLPPIKFKMLANKTLGVHLRQGDKKTSFQPQEYLQDPRCEHTLSLTSATSITIHLRWPGAVPYSWDVAKPKHSREYLLNTICTKTLNWLARVKQDESLSKGPMNDWHPSKLDVSKVLLLGLRQVSLGSWQPVFGLAYTAFRDAPGLLSPHSQQDQSFRGPYSLMPGMSVVPYRMHGKNTLEPCRIIQFKLVGSPYVGIPVHVFRAKDIEDPHADTNLTDTRNFRLDFEWPGFPCEVKQIAKTHHETRAQLAGKITLDFVEWLKKILAQAHPGLNNPFENRLGWPPRPGNPSGDEFEWHHPSKLLIERVRLLELRIVGKNRWQPIYGYIQGEP